MEDLASVTPKAFIHAAATIMAGVESQGHIANVLDALTSEVSLMYGRYNLYKCYDIHSLFKVSPGFVGSLIEQTLNFNVQCQFNCF